MNQMLSSTFFEILKNRAARMCHPPWWKFSSWRSSSLRGDLCFFQLTASIQAFPPWNYDGSRWWKIRHRNFNKRLQNSRGVLEFPLDYCRLGAVAGFTDCPSLGAHWQSSPPPNLPPLVGGTSSIQVGWTNPEFLRIPRSSPLQNLKDLIHRLVRQHLTELQATDSKLNGSLQGATV